MRRQNIILKSLKWFKCEKESKTQLLQLISCPKLSQLFWNNFWKIRPDNLITKNMCFWKSIIKTDTFSTIHSYFPESCKSLCTRQMVTLGDFISQPLLFGLERNNLFVCQSLNPSLRVSKGHVDLGEWQTPRINRVQS